MKKIIYLSILMLILFSFNCLGFSTLLQETNVSPTDTLVLEITTTTNPEKGDPYLVEWYDNESNLLAS